MNSLESSAQISERFEVNDLEFCSTCGTILPLPTFDDNLMCKLCKKTIDITGQSVWLDNIKKFCSKLKEP